MTDTRVKRLRPGERDLARRVFTLMARVFEEECEPLSGGYVDRLLSREDFWVMAAFAGDEIVGGLTAHELPMTRTESSELFIYDVAVRSDWQRRGVGRLLMTGLREEARSLGLGEMFVPADDDDTHALDFYRALGGVPAPVTIFTFSGSEKRRSGPGSDPPEDRRTPETGSDR
jgi:aminoglycoside 3-N-acetyltransferase I